MFVVVYASREMYSANEQVFFRQQNKDGVCLSLR